MRLQSYAFIASLTALLLLRPLATAQSPIITNLALNKSASQASDDTVNTKAALAVDGTTIGSVSKGNVAQTPATIDPWWQVDLGEVDYITTIQIYFPTDCCLTEDYYIFLSDVPFESTTWQATRGQFQVWNKNINNSPGEPNPNIVNVNRTARYVRIQKNSRNNLDKVSLSEIQVLGMQISTNPGVSGQWSSFKPLHNAVDAGAVGNTWDTLSLVHVSLLPSGKLLFWGRDKIDPATLRPLDSPFDGFINDIDDTSNAYVLELLKDVDPSTGLDYILKSVPNTRTNLFCAGHSFLPNGNLFVAGGTKKPVDSGVIQYGSDGNGAKQTNIFNWRTEEWENGPDMNLPRWYPSLVTLSDGEPLIISGSYVTYSGHLPNLTQDRDTEILANTSPLTFPPHAGLPLNLTELPNYPFVHLLEPDGKVFAVSGDDKNSLLYDPSTGWSHKDNLNLGQYHQFGTSVMYDRNKIMVIGGVQPMKDSMISAPTNQTEIIEFKTNGTGPIDFDHVTWVQGQPMYFERYYNTSVLMPDGKIFVVGGSKCGGSGNNNIESQNPAMCNAGAVMNPEIYDPGSNTWSIMSRHNTVRMYHSVALLLPDATILVAGGGRPGAYGESGRSNNGSSPELLQDKYLAHHEMEKFSPPYLFKTDGTMITEEARPAIIDTSNLRTITYGQSFNVQIGNVAATQIYKAVLVRLPSVTHALNFDQRRVVLVQRLLDQETLTVTAPANANEAPPGPYMLFVIDTNGVPSKAQMIILQVHPLPRRRAVAHAVPAGTDGDPYPGSVADKSSEPPDQFEFIAGALPAGLSLVASTGDISGVPALPPTIYDFTIAAVYADGQRVFQEYALPVCQSTSNPPMQIATIPVNTNYFISTVPAGNPPGVFRYDIIFGTLPPGMTLDASTGAISGTPLVSGNYLFKIHTTRAPGLFVPACPMGTSTDGYYQITVSCSTQCLSQYEGYNDGVDTDNIWGWAWDKSQPNTAIPVDIYDSPFNTVPSGAALLARVNANLPRQDLVDAGKGNGNHAFVFPVPDALKDGNTHRIHVVFAGTLQELGWSPRVLATSTGRFVGAHDNNACDRIDGYALDNWQINNPIDVDIFDNGQFLATVAANFDSTIVPATSGHGAHGFLYFTPDRLKDGTSHLMTIKFKLSGLPLPATSRTLSCPAVPPATNPKWDGFLDNVTCDRVDGWAWDENRPNSPIDVAMLVDGAQVATLTANQFGQDLLNAGKGNGVHRYFHYLPNYFKDGNSHHVTMRIIGQNTDLRISSGITNGDISCAALPPPTHPPFRPVVNTSTGTNSTASSGPATGTTPGVDVSFSSVSAEGLTSFVPINPSTLPQLPDGYVYPHAAINPIAFNISTTATYAGPVVLTFTILSETDPAEFATLRILHLESGMWQNQTYSASSLAGHQIIAQANSLGPFVIARALQNTTPATISVDSTWNSIYGGNAVFTAVVSSSVSIPAGIVTFMDGGQFLATVALDSQGQASMSTRFLSAGKHQLSVSYNGDGTFSPGVAQFVQVVAPAFLSVTPNPASRLYGNANPVFSGTILGLQNGDNITANYQSSATAASAVGTYSITAALSDPGGKIGNYTVSQETATLTITQAPLQVTANDKTRMYGAPNPVLDGVITGIKNADNIQAQYSTTATTQSQVGTYPITPALSDPNGRLGNYIVTVQNGTLTVTDCLSPPSPTNLAATAISNAQVNITWAAANAPVDHYELDRKQSISAAFIKIADVSASATSYTDLSVTGSVAYLYRVRAVCSSGSSSPSSNLDLATTMSFTDGALIAKATAIKAQHINELRSAVNAVRATAGLAQAGWTDPTLPGVAVKAVHITELRQSLNQALQTMGFNLPTYTDSTLSSGCMVKKAHVEELRQAVR